MRDIIKHFILCLIGYPVIIVVILFFFCEISANEIKKTEHEEVSEVVTEFSSTAMSSEDLLEQYKDKYTEYQLIIGRDGSKINAVKLGGVNDSEECRYLLDDYTYYVVYKDGRLAYYGKEGNRISESYNWYVQDLEDFNQMTGVQ